MKTMKLAALAGCALLMATVGGVSLVQAQDTNSNSNSANTTNDRSRENNREGENRRGGGDPAEAFKRMDTNGDGTVTKDEFRGPEDFFGRMDPNNDGKVTQDEFSQARQTMRRGGENDNNNNADGGRNRGGFGNFGSAAMYKERLNASDEEWTVLEPKIQKVMDIRQQVNANPFGRNRGGRGNNGGGNTAGGATNAPQSMPETDALRSTLENESASADEIKSKLTAYREARVKKEAELKAAREDVRGLLSARQEAVLVLAGLLD